MSTIFFNNLRRTFNSSARIVILVLIPLLFMNIFIPKDYEVPFKVAFIDEDGTVLTAQLRDKLADSFTLVDTSEADITRALVDKELDYALVARQGFTDSFLSTNSVALEGYAIDGPNIALAVKDLANSFLRSAQIISAVAGGNTETFSEDILALTAGSVGVEYIPTPKAGRQRTVGVLGFLVQFMVYMSVITTGLILEERSNRTLYRIFSAPVNARQYMTGHFMSALVVALVQVLSIFLFLKYVMSVYFSGFFLQMLVLYIIFAVVCICLGLLITSYCQNPRQAYVAIIMLTTPLVMLGGAYWPIDFMPDVLIRISKLLPTTWVIEASRKLVEGGSLVSISGEIAILLAFATVFFLGGVLRKVDIAK